jgi:hypothetical protein
VVSAETSSHTVSSYVGGGVCLRREYEVNGEDDSWLSSCKYDPKGESASTTRAATANANSKAIQDDRAEVGKHTHWVIRGPRSEGKAAVRDLRSETCRMSSFCGAAVFRVESESRLMLICLILATLWFRVMDTWRRTAALKRLPGQPRLCNCCTDTLHKRFDSTTAALVPTNGFTFCRGSDESSSFRSLQEHRLLVSPLIVQEGQRPNLDHPPPGSLFYNYS